VLPGENSKLAPAQQLYLFDGSIERAAVDFAIGPNIRLQLTSPFFHNGVEL
jgi:hypothetical protein